MTLFVDASALVPIIHDEPESAEPGTRLVAEQRRLTSGLAVWEAARALGRYAGDDWQGALLEVQRYCAKLRIRIVSIGAEEAMEAVHAHIRHRKGTGHGARFNMGDCFAYARARTNNARLLYKGDDFSRTDLA